MTSMFGQIVRALLLVLGAIMLLFGLWFQFGPRARYTGSSPKPGSVLSESPSNITINFSRELTAESRMTVVSTMTVSPSGEAIHEDRRVSTITGPDTNDAQGQTLRVNVSPELPAGLYWVNWTVFPKSVGVRSYGSFYFVVGMPLPTYLTGDSSGGLHEQHRPGRRQRAVLISGVILLAMGFFIPSRIWKL
jgi:methionine-rich copper-binding protein CopC